VASGTRNALAISAGQSTHGPGKRALHAAFEAGQGEPRLTCQHIDAIAHGAAWNSAKPVTKKKSAEDEGWFGRQLRRIKMASSGIGGCPSQKWATIESVQFLGELPQ